MRTTLTFLRKFFLFLFLTLLTQIGGLVYLLCLPIFQFFKRRMGRPIAYILLNFSLYCLFYVFFSFIIVPPLAAYFGRVAMPFDEENPNLRQLNRWTVILNRHYVTPQLRDLTEGVVKRLVLADKDIILTYLDCNFPFWEGFPLTPHLSHNDGRKIDLSFFYINAETQKMTDQRPSWLGYGVCEEPRSGEENRPEYCEEHGNWQYTFLSNYIVSQSLKRQYPFDERRTAALIRFLIADNRTKTVLIEPHLERRLGFKNEQKVKTPPCNSVRHDDHIHVAIY